MKYVFSFLLLIHGLIHILGFIKVFNLGEINQLSQNISKPNGILWLLTFLLLFITTISYLRAYKFWFVIAFFAILISQILIVLFWKDAKFGTIANLIILIVSLHAYGKFQFDRMVEIETNQTLQHIKPEKPHIVTEKDLSKLPEAVKKWLKSSGIIGHDKSQTIQLRQLGEMRTKANGKWMPFTATQTFNLEEPAFIWKTKVEAMPLISLYGRDKLYLGEGSMLIKFVNLIPIVNEEANTQINTGAMIRFLAEICWFPSAALNDYIIWETLDSSSAKATFTIKDISVTGIFKFSKKGNISSFEAMRYYGGKKDSKLETWHVEMTSYKIFNGIKIPNKSRVSWKLLEGDFNWLNLEIIELKTNI